MKPLISITVPEPCSQRREDMQPVMGGRYCRACAQMVTDFTLMSDAQILTFVKNAAGGHFCGSFLPSQLGRELIPAPKLPWRIAFSQRAAAAVLLAQLTIAQATAQTKKQPARTAQSPQASSAMPRMIQGRVLDYATRLPVAGVRIRLLDTTLITNKYGRFQFPLPVSALAGDVVSIEAILPEGDNSRAVFSEQITLSGRQLQQVVMYRYPQEQLPAATIATPVYHAGGIPVIDGGASMYVRAKEPPAKHGFWTRVAKPFRKKQRRNVD